MSGWRGSAATDPIGTASGSERVSHNKPFEVAPLATARGTGSIKESVLSDLLQYIGSIALLIVILLAGSVAAHFFSKWRGKK